MLPVTEAGVVYLDALPLEAAAAAPQPRDHEAELRSLDQGGPATLPLSQPENSRKYLRI